MIYTGDSVKSIAQQVGNGPSDWLGKYLQWVAALAQRYDDEKTVMSQDEYDAIYNQDYLDVMENEDRMEVTP